MYTRNVNAQIFLNLLKKYNIRKIVISPGAQNFGIGGSVLDDDWFEAYSVVDERSAAYFATGLAFESGEPVVLSCTGATASRNYLPGLTEAYYRKLPVIALTGTHYHPDKNDFSPQSVDRTVVAKDVQLYSAELPPVKDEGDFKLVQKRVNEALIIATEQKLGPVHLDFINTEYLLDVECLPEVQELDYVTVDKARNLDKLSGKIGVLIGSHSPFPKETQNAISKFAKKFSAPVFCDHTANYHGVNKILISQVLSHGGLEAYPDILIDLGGVIGDYNVLNMAHAKEAWRISEDGVLHDRYGNTTKLFDMREIDFFNLPLKGRCENYYKSISSQVINEIDEENLPLSNTLVAKTLSEKLPRNSYLHLGILNSLRNMDLFNLDESITVSSNVGGFGIDGAISTIVGQSMVNPEKLHFCVLGDLAFFYDMNALGIRHIGSNLRILVVNNGRGVEFRITPPLEDQVGKKLDEFTAAARHNGSAKAWAKAMGFEYISAQDKDELKDGAERFCTDEDLASPILFEVFTSVEDEKTGLKIATGKQ